MNAAAVKNHDPTKKDVFAAVVPSMLATTGAEPRAKRNDPRTNPHDCMRSVGRMTMAEV